MAYDLIIWDFNGTIVDDVELGIRSVNTMLKKRGLPVLADAEEYRTKLRFPIIDYYRDLGFDFDAEPYSVLAHEWVALYNAGEDGCLPCPGAPEAIRRISDAHVPQIIISASEKGMLLRTLDRFGLTDYFEKIIAQDNVYAAGKLESARAFAKTLESGASPVRAVVIGDTMHDFEMAQALGADCILFTGGHARRSDIAACGAYAVDDLREAAQIALS